MSTTEKLIERFCRFPDDFSFEEAVRLLSAFGYREHGKGMASGSRVRFKNKWRGEYVDIHRSRPGSLVKERMMRAIYRHLRDNGLMK